MSTPISYADTPRNRILKHLGRDVLFALDSLGIGVYWRALLTERHKRVRAAAEQVAQLLATFPSGEVGEVEGMPLAASAVPFRAACSAHGDILCCHVCGRVCAEQGVTQKKVPPPILVRRNRKRANIGFTSKAHRRSR